MTMHKNINDILEFILHKASRYDLELMEAALKKRFERESGMGQLDIKQMARTMTESINKQMGVGEGQMHQMSRRLVEDMIRKEKPGLSQGEINKIVDHLVPGSGERSATKSSVPREMLLSMITQFVSFSTGEMNEEEKRQFPQGWHKKYWDAFPVDVQKGIKEYVSGTIGKNEFWKRIREIFAGIK